MSAAADSAGDTSIPPGSVLSSNLIGLRENTHLFFDDDMKYIGPVQALADANPGFNLQTVYCQIPNEFGLYNLSGHQIISNPTNFRKAKLSGILNKDFKEWLSRSKAESSVGTGLTVDVIRALIDREAQSDKKCMYFFDFDQTLTYVKGLNFDFVLKMPSIINDSIKKYAKYIFSDFCGEEPKEGTGRLHLLQRLFELIGPERIYIITSNELACRQIKKKDGTLGSTNPFLPHFICLIQQLLPNFNNEHLISTCQNNSTSRFSSKVTAISKIIHGTQSIGGSTTRKNKSSSHKKKYSRVPSKKTKYRRRHLLTTRNHRK